MELTELQKHNKREEMWCLMCMFAERPDWDIFTIDRLGHFNNLDRT